MVKVTKWPLGVVLVSMWWPGLQESFSRSLSHYSVSVTFYLVCVGHSGALRGHSPCGRELPFQWKETDKESVPNMVW